MTAVRRFFIDRLGPDGVDALETALARLDAQETQGSPARTPA